MIVAAIEAFVGVGALYGGSMLLTDAGGFGMEASWLEGTPFPDYTVPGLALLLGMGGGMLAAAAAAASGSRWAAPAAAGMGAALLAFLAIEIAVIGYQGPQQIVLLAVMGAAATVLIVLGRAQPERPAP